MALFFISINKLFSTLLYFRTLIMDLKTHIKHILEIVRIIPNGDRVPLYLTKTLGAVDIPLVRIIL